MTEPVRWRGGLNLLHKQNLEAYVKLCSQTRCPALNHGHAIEITTCGGGIMLTDPLNSRDGARGPTLKPSRSLRRGSLRALLGLRDRIY